MFAGEVLTDRVRTRVEPAGGEIIAELDHPGTNPVRSPVRYRAGAA